MEKETSYILKEDEIKGIVAFIVLKVVIASMSKDPDSLNMEVMTAEVVNKLEKEAA